MFIHPCVVGDTALYVRIRVSYGCLVCALCTPVEIEIVVNFLKQVITICRFSGCSNFETGSAKCF